METVLEDQRIKLLPFRGALTAFVEYASRPGKWFNRGPVDFEDLLEARIAYHMPIFDEHQTPTISPDQWNRAQQLRSERLAPHVRQQLDSLDLIGQRQDRLMRHDRVRALLDGGEYKAQAIENLERMEESIKSDPLTVQIPKENRNAEDSYTAKPSIVIP